jgi:sugar phosphate isomerase/epimerase
MYLGIFTVVFQNQSFDVMLDRVHNLGLDCVEIGTGGYPGNHHCDIDGLLADSQKLQEFGRQIQAAGLFISGLACPGNPLHPNADVAREHRAAFEKTVRLAELLEVPVINLLSGCPGESLNSRYPNWCHFAWPPEYSELWKWQWNEVAIPYWTRAAEFAKNHGIRRLGIEMHPGFLVYNPATALKLREAVGDIVGVNLDPSHLFWLGIDVPTAIRKLGSAIFHVHAKDCAINTANVSLNGFFDGQPYQQIAQRSWNFRTVGWGHGMEAWRSITSALREVGYDYVLSIEHEDPLLSPEEGLRSSVSFLKQVLLRKPAGAMYWA